MTNDGTIADALARAQATFEVPKKSRTVTVRTRDAGTYTFAYAELADVLAATGPSLNREGIAYTQSATTDLERKVVRVWTVLRRGSEQIETEPLELPLSRIDAQGVGSAITYARRYQLSAVLGVAAEDDDGQAASDRTRSEPEPGAPPPPRRAKVSDAQMKRLHAIAKAKGITHSQMTDWAGRHLGIETLAELDKRGAGELEKALAELPDVPDDAGATVGDGGTAPAAASSESSRAAAADAAPAGDGSDALDGESGVAGGSASQGGSDG